MLNKFLKNARKNAGLTQKKAAELIEGVSITTIQNWEKSEKPVTPAQIFWPAILKTYNISKEDFMKELKNNVFQENGEDIPETTKESDFLNMLFLDSDKNLMLTQKEQELLGIQELYLRNYKDNLVVNYPYSYVEKFGAFGILNLEDSLNNKGLVYNSALRSFVVKYIRKNPEKLFNVKTLSDKECWEFYGVEHDKRFLLELINLLVDVNKKSCAGKAILTKFIDADKYSRDSQFKFTSKTLLNQEFSIFYNSYFNLVCDFEEKDYLNYKPIQANYSPNEIMKLNNFIVTNTYVEITKEGQELLDFATKYWDIIMKG